jgi:hypothetical protein
MSIGKGTNWFAALGDTVEVALTNDDGNAMLAKCLVGDIPSSVAGYGKGCLLIDITNGALYINTGSATSCTFQLV